MSRQAERIPQTRDERRRCEAGWRGGSCKKRTCAICGLVWAKDWRRVLFEALKSLGVPVALSAVTPPGMDQLPWDERHCAHIGPHKHGKRHGCRVDEDALAEWSYDVSKRWKRLHNAARNATKREMGRCLSLATRAWEPQARGPGHVHPVFHSTRRPMCVSSVLPGAFGSARSETQLRCRWAEAGSEPADHGGSRAAAYLSSYFVRGRGGKATLQDNARNPHLPHMLIWVSPTLTRTTGVNMRNLRRCRQLWAVRLGLLPPPSWSAVELARVVALAGPWPARGP